LAKRCVFGKSKKSEKNRCWFLNYFGVFTFLIDKIVKMILPGKLKIMAVHVEKAPGNAPTGCSRHFGKCLIGELWGMPK
jgi:hypothetical protein